MNVAEQDRQTRQARLEHLLRCVPMILTEVPAIENGSGCFFRRGDEHYLVTASHVAKDLMAHPDRCSIAREPSGPSEREMWTLGRATVRYAEAQDVAVLRLETPAAVTAFRENGWTFLTDDDVSFEMTDDFLVFGWPFDDLEFQGANKFGGQKIAPRPIEIRTRRHQNPEGQLPLFESDIFLQWPETPVPRLAGISGSPIWNVVMPEGGLFHPSKELRVVGIQHRVAKGSYIRGTEWAVIEVLLSSMPAREP